MTLEYGHEFRSKRTVHEGMLCCHSPKVQEMCTKAKSLRDQYEQCEEIAEELTLISMSMDPTKYLENKVEEQVCGFMRICFQSNHLMLFA